jgi:spore coat polysaccharide biosynthesis protein SpsF
VPDSATDRPIVAVLQARASSSRLPGKVLLPICGEPMLARQIERIARSNRITRLIVATSTDRSDDALDALCKCIGVDVFRGSLENVLDRFYQAASRVGPAYVVRLTGDCPLADPAVIDAVIAFCIDGGFDYATNALEATFPDGLDVEVMTIEALREAWEKATLPSEREHVTPYIHRNPARFKIGHYKQCVDHSDLRWTVDEKLDYELVCKIYDELYPTNAAFASGDILRFLDANPELKVYNKKFERNEGFRKSLERDQAFVASTKAQ